MALTKTSAIDVIDAWQSVAYGVQLTGITKNVADSYESMLQIEASPITAQASELEITVEVSYDDANWVALPTFSHVNTGSNYQTTLDGSVSAAGTALVLTASTYHSDVGQKLLVFDGVTAANSETVIVATDAGSNTVTLCDPLLRDHATATVVSSVVDQWNYVVPTSASKVRVRYNNVDANCNMAVTSRILKVTGL